MAAYSDEFIKRPDGANIYVQSWFPEETKAYFLIAHGLGEHGERYAHMADFFNQKQIGVVAPDFRGHGRTPGKRGHINSLTNVVNDLDAVRQHILQTNGQKPVILFGHSMGGLIACRYLLDYQQNLRAAILSAPAIGIKAEPPAWQKKLVSALASLLPSMTLNNGLDAAWLSHDQHVVQAYRDDPLVHPKISLRLFLEMDQNGKQCLNRAGDIKLPVMLIYGGQDRIIDSAKAHAAFEQLSNSNKTEFVVQDAYHEVHNEPDHIKEFEAIWKWLAPLLK